jgi:hypothetical protein
MDSTQRARYPAPMGKLYGLTKGQSAIPDLFRARSSADGERELVMVRWGMSGPGEDEEEERD